MPPARFAIAAICFSILPQKKPLPVAVKGLEWTSQERTIETE